MNGAVGEVIFEDGGVSVSRTTLRVKSKTYAIAGIGSVEVVPGERATGIGGTIFLAIASAVTWVTVDDRNLGWAYGLAILAALVALGTFVQPHRLMIRTASGELQAMDGKKADLTKVKEAIEKAFALRG